MTREEKIKGLYSLKEYLLENPIELEGHVSLPITLIDYAIEAIEQEPILDKISAEIAEYGSIWVEYKITGRRDKDIEQLVSGVLKQAKEQVLEVIDKYKAESEDDE